MNSSLLANLPAKVLALLPERESLKKTIRRTEDNSEIDPTKKAVYLASEKLSLDPNPEAIRYVVRSHWQKSPS